VWWYQVKSNHTYTHTQRLVSKKKQFYRMKVHHTQQLARQQCHSLKQKQSVAMETTYSRMRVLHQQLKTVCWKTLFVKNIL